MIHTAPSIAMSTLTFLAVCALGWVGCAKPGDDHLAPLNDAHRAVEQGMTALATWDVDSVKAARNRVGERLKDLDWLVADTTLTFAVADGQLIGDWNRVKRFLKDGPERLTALAKEGKVCLAQLDNLAAAIREEATVDSEGTPMDEVYFAKAAARELELVAKWEAAIAETKRLVSSGLELEGQTRASLDSLIRAKRAEWARQIAENE
jgi:hypothetical protein